MLYHGSDPLPRTTVLRGASPELNDRFRDSMTIPKTPPKGKS